MRLNSVGGIKIVFLLLKEIVLFYMRLSIKEVKKSSF